jgi:ribosomal-protein-alanine N-acetyltransferase
MHPPSPEHPLIGYGGVWLGVDEAHITTIAVHPLYRGRGIGELLLNGLIDMAFDMNVSSLTLEVRASNTVAQNLYLKYGFLPTGHRRRYYTDNREDAVIMTTIPITSIEYRDRLKQLRWLLFTRLRSYADNQATSSLSSCPTNSFPISPEVPTRVD